MEFQITIAGEAGQGIARAADLVARDFVSRGMYVFNYRDYGSLIKGGENFNILRISNKKVHSNNWKNDYLMAFGRFSDHHLGKMNKGGVALGTIAKIKNKVDAYGIVRELKAPPITVNSVLLGALYRAMNQPIKGLLKQMGVFGKHADLNRKAAQIGYDKYSGEVRPVLTVSKIKKRYFVSGSEAISYGAVSAGLDLYLAYPMTPATPILHILANMTDRGIGVVQLDNEIGVANGALGASYAGATTMVGTSGGGFALMNEALSLQGMSEMPLVVYLAMRPGPASGIPTYTGQGDMKFALNAGHGDFSKIVVAPGDPLEAFERTAESIYLSNKYGALTILLGDKHLAESNYTLDHKPCFKVKPSRFLVKPTKNFKPYALTHDGVSPRAPAGTGLIRATSYEHDEAGYTTEESSIINQMVEKRLKKAKTLEKAVNKLSPIKTYGKGSDLIVSYGSTKGAIIDALKGFDAKFLQISYLKPFPSRRVKTLLESARRVVTVENCATPQLADVVAENTGFRIEKHILKYDGRPFGQEELVKELRRVFK